MFLKITEIYLLLKILFGFLIIVELRYVEDKYGNVQCVHSHESEGNFSCLQPEKHIYTNSTLELILDHIYHARFNQALQKFLFRDFNSSEVNNILSKHKRSDSKKLGNDMISNKDNDMQEVFGVVLDEF
ncbi:uncharacterized protein ACRADG_003095 isoform 1-T1 [Cochliomyia hominivorax]